MKLKFPDGWDPPKKLSRDQMEQVRSLHKLDPERFDVPALKEQFKISSEAVRRILRSRWVPAEMRRVHVAMGVKVKVPRRERERQDNIRERGDRRRSETKWSGAKGAYQKSLSESREERRSRPAARDEDQSKKETPADGFYLR